MKRLYFLTEDVNCVERISDDIHRWGISDWNFHVLSKDEAGLNKHHIHSATPIQSRDIIHSGERGALIGIAAGIAAALAVAVFTPVLSSAGLLPFIAIIFICTMFGAWTGGLFGVQEENYKVQRFSKDIEAGKYLIMIDVKKSQLELVNKVMSDHPAARAAGVDSTVVNPLATAGA